MGGTSGSKELVPGKSVAGHPLHFRGPPNAFCPYVCSLGTQLVHWLRA
jgi:hypothetical protein